jgi:hypothetical protein
MTASSWTNDTAMQQLESQLGQAATLRGRDSGDEDLVSWMLTTRRLISEIFGESSDYFRAYAALRWSPTGTGTFGGPSRPEESFNPELGLQRLRREAISRNLNAARGIIQAGMSELASKDIASVYHGKDTGPEASTILQVVHLAEAKLRQIIREPPAREKIVQDKFEDLLVANSINYAREAENVPYSSKTYIPDFTIDRADLAIEIKLCNRDGREKEIIAEINDDIVAYRQRWGNLFFVIYDVGQIRDIARFTSSFESEAVLVRVVKH